MISSTKDWSAASPKEVRDVIRQGLWKAPTPGMAKGHVQANLAILPKDWAYDFLVFATRNPIPCPVLDITEPGDPEPKFLAPGADIRRDIPKYRIWKEGVCVEEPSDITSFWRDDLVAFLLGCSFTFESALLDADIPVRHIEEGVNVPMYLTSRPCKPAGRLRGNMVVSMRPIPAPLVSKAVLTTGRFPGVHGAPVHIGSPEDLGIRNIARPDFGDAVTIRPGEVPVFWGCGVTPQAALMASKPPFAITHAPGYMFVGDILDRDLAIF
jgi:uncharacterized protein YcsI (UPF0317 family)